MPSLLCLVLDHAPYGSISAAEAIRHAAGAVGKGWEVALAFMGDSVYAALPKQSPPSGEWVSCSEAIGDFLQAGGERARVLVDLDSLDRRVLAPGDLIAGVRPASPDEIARSMGECDRTLVF